jgi:hypothetical protein
MGADETVVAEVPYGEIRGSVAGDINAVWKTFCRSRARAKRLLMAEAKLEATE